MLRYPSDPHECRPPGEPETPVRLAGDVTPEKQQRISQIMTSGHLTEGLNPAQPQAGIHDGVPFEDYLAWPYVSQLTLKPMLTSPAHYRYQLDNPPEDKDCWRFGRICHHGKLEPLEALQRYTVMPDFVNGPLMALVSPIRGVPAAACSRSTRTIAAMPCST